MRTTTDDRLDAAFAALADPTRRAILSRLARGDATVGELAAPFEMSLPGISKHLKVLERSGLISRGRNAQFRPCHLEPEALDGALDWITTHRRLWGERFDKLDALLADLQRTPGRRAPGRRAPERSGAPDGTDGKSTDGKSKERRHE
jgi:DNA-binding transcriptional ArsR family regulator